ncbi:MAG: hypothetical protein COA74_05605 [Gammaproteobacteria bacterium]|nr:MAG: hypothetical protein COA74_05605 [Gammaproteobacteria bacterium]
MDGKYTGNAGAIYCLAENCLTKKVADFRLIWWMILDRHFECQSICYRRRRGYIHVGFVAASMLQKLLPQRL